MAAKKKATGRRPSVAARAKTRPTKKTSKSTLTRKKNPMPAWVRSALLERGLMVAYRARPAFQQNDYLGWIASAAREETQEKRLAQMLDELARGGVYMNMKWRPRPQVGRASAR